MNTPSLPILGPVVVAGLAITSVHAAPLVTGTKIGLDFGSTPTNVVGNDWNEITGNGTLAAGAVKDLNAAVVDGVAVTTVDGQFFNNDGSDNWVALASNPAVIAGPKLPPEFIDSVTTDIGGNFNFGDARPFTVTITGLDPNLAYDIVAASSAGAGGTVIDTYNLTGRITYGPSAVTRSNAHANGIWHSFPGVVATTAGTITLRVTDTSASANPIINGILLTAVNLPDSDFDGLPDFWEVLFGLNKNDNAGVNGTDGDPDLDGFSNLDEYNGGSLPNNLASTPLDTDGDGLTDTWEMANFGNLAPTGMMDPDGDLATNDQEETADSNPNSGISWPDSDLDGMNDAWELASFGGLSRDGTLDNDNDSWTDSEEFEALSNPTSSAWTPVMGTLAHRWSFNGDLMDSVGSSPAAIIEVGANNVTQNPTDITLIGGTRAVADYVSLGANLLAGKAAPVTIELWATQNAVQNYGRIFDFGSSTNEFLTMTWSNGTTVNQDTVRWQDSANGSVSNTNAPYTTDTEYHIVMMIEPAKGIGGSSLVRWWSAPSSSPDLGSVKGSMSVANNLVNFVDSLAALGRSQFGTDGTASASYNEVRIWNGALGDWQREALHDQNAENATILDNDGDGLADAWEIANGLNPNSNAGADGATGDPDGDSMTNRDEFANGSNPRDYRWIHDDNGNWNTAANWNIATVPNGIGAAATLDDLNLTQPVIITLDSPVTLGILRTDSLVNHTIAGTNSLTFDTSTGDALLEVVAGTPVISTPVVLEDSLNVQIAAGMTVTLGGSLANGTGFSELAKSGTGELVLGGDTSAFTGGIAIKAGTIALTRSGDFTLTNTLSGTGRLAHRGGGTLALAGSNTHGGTDVTGGVLTIASTADLGNGGVALDNGTLVTTADLNADTRVFQVGLGGGILEVADATTLTTVPFTGIGNPLRKNGPGTWRIQGGNSASIGMLTISAGTLDLNRNDSWGGHAASTQALTIQPGGLVTNGPSITSGYNTVQTLAMEGGELRVTGTARALVDGDLYRFEAYGIRDSITVTGTAASSITNPGAITNAGINIGGHTDLGGGAGPDLTVNVAEVTGSSAADLTVSAVLKNNYTASFAPLANGLVKTGAGTLNLTALNRYTGTTSVEAGTLALSHAFLADAADVKIITGAILQLDFASTDTIDELFIDGLPQATGTWGRSGHPTAEHTTSLIIGDGLLQVITGPAGGYTNWANGFLPAFANTAADLDFDNEGLASGIEWVVGGNPTLNDAASVAPTFDNTTDPDKFLFTFRRRDDAVADPNTTIVVEYGSNLAGWTPAQDGVNGVSINDTTDLGGGFHQVTVAIPRALAADGKLFARLRVAVKP